MLEPSLNVTPEGSLVDIPTVVKRETIEQVPEEKHWACLQKLLIWNFSNTQVKTMPKDPILGVPKSLQGTKEASRAEALASTQQFFAAVDQRNRNVSAGNQVTSVEGHERENIEVPGVQTTTVATTTTSITTPPITLDAELIGTSSPRN